MTDPTPLSASFVFENRKCHIQQKKRTKRTRILHGSPSPRLPPPLPSPAPPLPPPPPPRACRARTPSRLAPPAPSVQRSSHRRGRATRSSARSSAACVDDVGSGARKSAGDVRRGGLSAGLGRCDRIATADGGGDDADGDVGSDRDGDGDEGGDGDGDGDGDGGKGGGGRKNTGSGNGGKVASRGNCAGSGPMALVPTPPPTPDRDPAWSLRHMWELASILHFLNVFRPILRFNSKFTIKDLENALLMPNSLLEEIHIALLKAIRPIYRTPINQDTWVALLCKKMTEWWPWVAQGAFPLAPYHGDELETYMELTPDVRVIILKALCEARADQEDVRAFIDDMLKKGVPLSHIRKERTGIDMQGSRYWYENDPISGQRLYRELRNTEHKDKPNLRGRSMPPPITCNWETLATEFDEFQSVADKLSSSWNRMEITIGKRINNNIIPDLKDLQKKRERTLKQQQRQAILLNSHLNNEDLTTGRSKRERKPVKYTFDDYDKSISEAIKITKRQHPSPETVIAHSKTLNGSIKKRLDEESNFARKIIPSATKRKHKATKVSTSESFESPSILSGDRRQYGRGRRNSKEQRYSEDDFDNAVSERKSDYSSDDIEGEVVYADNYMERKRKQQVNSDNNDEFKGDDEDKDEHGHDYEGSSDEGLSGQKTHARKQRGIKKEIQDYEAEKDEFRDTEQEEDEYRDKEEVEEEDEYRDKEEVEEEDEYRDKEEEEEDEYRNKEEEEERDEYRDKEEEEEEEEEEDEYRDDEEEEDEYRVEEEEEDECRDREDEENEGDGHPNEVDNEEGCSDGVYDPRKHYVKQRIASKRTENLEKPSSKSHIDYMKCEASDVECDQEMKDSDIPAKPDSDECADNCNTGNDVHNLKQLEVADDIHGVKQLSIKAQQKVKRRHIINGACEVEPLNHNRIHEAKKLDIDSVCDVKQLQCTRGRLDEQHDIISRDHNSKITWYADDGNVTGPQAGDAERQLIDEVRCQPCEDDKKTRNKLQRYLDLNVVG